jgi:PAS domain S-box-containing protein
MRSQFQFGNYCYVGTIEGLYLINTEVLRRYPSPPKPVILPGRENDHGEIQVSREKHYYTFKCLLPKSNAIMFSYRVKGILDKWSDFSFENEVDIPDLPSGEYELEVRASYDGITISPTATYEIVVDIPIWRTKWFIVLIVIILGVINIAYLEWSKSYLSNNIFNTKDVSVDGKVVPQLILFALVVYGVMLFIVRMVDHSFEDTGHINLIFSSVLLMLFLMSRYYVRQAGNPRLVTGIFYVAYTTIMVESYYLIYVTNVHPFPVFSITMATSVIPFVVTRIRWVIIISLLQLFAAATLLIWMENTVYNEILFIAAVTISGGIAVMVTYLRNNSLEKLIFVSGLINKGNVMALSFNQKGIITYCSENITNFFAIDFSTVVGKPSSVLNPFVATSEMREISLRDEFEDGRIFLIPMYNKNNDVVWIEWSCKYFNDAVRVIMGQDVTDKLTLSTNYQSLVENAQDMIYHTDIQANFIFANERCVQLFGYRNETIIGKNAVSLIAPDHRDRVHQFYQDQFKNRIHHTYLEFPIKSRDGRVFWVGQNVTMVYEPGSRKRISGFIALARDITEKRANDLLIEQQNKDITASINSAKRIQFNLLPEPQILTRYFDQSFVLFKPKDIVSGDFYWIEEIDHKLIVVLADCTGHGVPGAFMTILGINLLNQIVRERKQCEPDVILNQLNSELELILHKNTGSVMFDSMEMLVCVFEKDRLCYASSGVPFVHEVDGELMLYRSTKSEETIGETGSFGQRCLAFKASDTFYLFTDGYQKQFGSIRNKKFGFKRIQELLDKIHVESMPLQKKYFENAWRNWSEGHEQTDDITILGVRGFRREKKTSSGPETEQ